MILFIEFGIFTPFDTVEIQIGEQIFTIIINLN